MSLTKSQVENFRQIEEGLQLRKPVLLTGKSNGKTTLIHQALEALAQRDERRNPVTGELRYVSQPRHSENSQIEYFPRVYFPAAGSITVQHTMRQILTFAGVGAKEIGHNAAKVVQAFDAFLSKNADESRMICLAVDNAELLSPKAYTVLKVLNEYRDVVKRRNVGVGLLIAGEMKKIKKIPTSFLMRCNEVQIGKITSDEIADLIMTLYPSQIRFFTDKALTSLAKCQTTLQIKNVVDRCVATRTRYRLIEIENDLVEEKMAA